MLCNRSVGIATLMTLCALPVICYTQAIATELGKNSEQLLYENDALGIKIVGPAGWFMSSGDKVQQIVPKGIGDITQVDAIRESVNKAGILVVFTPFGTPKEVNPNITLTREEIPEEYKAAYKTSLDVANANIITIKVVLKDFKFITEPTAVTIGGQEAAYFVWECTRSIGFLETRLRCAGYSILKEGAIYSLVFTDSADNFDNNAELFKSIVNSLIIL